MRQPTTPMQARAGRRQVLVVPGYQLKAPNGYSPISTQLTVENS